VGEAINPQQQQQQQEGKSTTAIMSSRWMVGGMMRALMRALMSLNDAAGTFFGTMHSRGE